MGRQRNQPLRLGIVGCGFAAEDRHLPALATLREIEVVALADLDMARCQRVADRFQVPQRYAGAAELLEHADVDAVAVCTAATSHAEVALEALAAGKHVLVEKPLSLSLAEADGLVQRADESPGTAAVVGFNLRWHRLARRARALLLDGRLGRVTAITSAYTDSVSRPRLPPWRTRRELGGGALLEKLVHVFDLWRFLLDDEVEEVFAVARHDPADDAVVAVTARMRSGAVAHALGSDVTAVGIDFGVFGDAGSLRLDLYRFDGLDLAAREQLPGAPLTRARRILSSAAALGAGARELRLGGLFDATYVTQWRAFARAVAGGHIASAGFEDGRRALRVALAAAESASSGRPVLVSEAPATLPPPVPATAGATQP